MRPVTSPADRPDLTGYKVARLNDPRAVFTSPGDLRRRPNPLGALLAILAKADPAGRAFVGEDDLAALPDNADVRVWFDPEARGYRIEPTA